MSFVFNHNGSKFWAKELKDRTEVYQVAKHELGRLRVVAGFNSKDSTNSLVPNWNTEFVYRLILDKRPNQEQLISLIDKRDLEKNKEQK